MKIRELIDNYNGSYSELNVTDITFDAGSVKKGSLFFCLKGVKHDGHDFVGEAVKRGAAAVVTERETEDKIPSIKVENTRSALAVAAKHFYGDAADRLKIYAVTGTNGKTTTAFMLKSILDKAGYATGIIGTNGISYNGVMLPSSLTTPDPTELHKIFADMERAGVTHVVMEASAHALALKKLDGIKFAVCGFTNFTRDHLDFFGDMESYKAAKKLLFQPEKTDISVINFDDPSGKEMSISKKGTVFYGLNNRADLYGAGVFVSNNGTAFYIHDKNTIKRAQLNIPGRFNVYNALCAVGMARALGVDLTVAVSGLKELKSVDGRFNAAYTKKGTVIVDFAHTDDGLKNILSSAKEFTQGKLIAVFGCGGNRDRTKRPLMGKAVAKFADTIIVTSDNPRDEEPLDIINDAVEGIKEVGFVDYSIVPNRAEAIENALSLMKKGDTVVIAGKGAENYQEIKGVKHEFNDMNYVLRLIEEKGL